MTTTMTWKLCSIKRTESIDGSLADAIQRAREIDAEYQPAFGVHVEDAATGETVVHDVSDQDEVDEALRSATTIAVVDRWTAHGDDIDCETPQECTDASHEIRHIVLRVTLGDGSVLTGEALFARDAINGGWERIGDSIDCWLTLEPHAPSHVVRAIVEHIGGGAAVGYQVEVRP